MRKENQKLAKRFKKLAGGFTSQKIFKVLEKKCYCYQPKKTSEPVDLVSSQWMEPGRWKE